MASPIRIIINRAIKDEIIFRFAGIMTIDTLLIKDRLDHITEDNSAVDMFHYNLVRPLLSDRLREKSFSMCYFRAKVACDDKANYAYPKRCVIDGYRTFFQPKDQHAQQGDHQPAPFMPCHGFPAVGPFAIKEKTE